jgi:hypothetical protein
VTAPHKLETPTDPAELYLARREDIDGYLHRPWFTGDVVQLEDGRQVALVQHPYAMRRGTEIARRLLVCGVGRREGAAPRDWSTGHFKRMFLPEMDGPGLSSVEFEDIEVIDREDIATENRRVILSQTGVNLLVQRLIHHNNRILVPTITINE